MKKIALDVCSNENQGDRRNAHRSDRIRSRFSVPTLSVVLALLASCDQEAIGDTPVAAKKGPKNKKVPPILPPPKVDAEWNTVVNNTYAAPGSELTFNSYNQPSVDGSGVVVFRARTRGGMGGMRARGVYTCDMSGLESCLSDDIEVIADATTLAPAPNNTQESFIEFPSIPRITADASPNSNAGSGLVATRGQHQPVWEYSIEDEETRVGTTGIYTKPALDGTLATAASQVGIVPGFEYFAVPMPYPSYDPNVDEPLKFDVFPGAPSPTIVGADEVITFKGNYTVDDVGKTGVFFRYLNQDQPVQLIANSYTALPNPPDEDEDAVFGSTAPPSAHGAELVFTGYILEEMPTLGGGIYRAPLEPEPQLETLVGIGDPVPDAEDQTTGFTQFGEGLSFDGRYVGFWGAWGEDTRTLFLPCPTEGNQDRIAYCNENLPAYPEDCVGDDCVHGMIVSVPIHQGVFIHDTQMQATTMVAQTDGEDIIDFLYWNYSGAVPELDAEPDQEPPRFRSSAFVSVSAGVGNLALLAFKATSASYEADFHGPGLGGYAEVVDRLHLGKVIANANTTVTPLLSTGDDGQSVDPQAPVGSMVTAIGLERDSLRAPWLVISAAMAFELDADEEDEGMAGIYLRQVGTTPGPP